MSNQVTIKPIETVEELNQVSLIDQLLFTNDFYQPEAWNNMFLNPYYDLICLIDHDQVKGFLCLLSNPDEIEIIRIGVHPASQRQGYGSLLMQVAETMAIKSNKKLLLEVSSHNQKAQNLYLKCGFVVIGKRKQYYLDNSDAIIMEKSFNH